MNKWKKISDSLRAQLLETPCEAVLMHFNCRVDHKRNMFYNPFKEEDNPSLHINKDNEYHLFSDGYKYGGGVVDLCKRLLMHTGDELFKEDDSCCTKQELAKRKNRIFETLGLINGIRDIYDDEAEINPQIKQTHDAYKAQRKSIKESAIHVVSDLQPLTDISLVEYLQSRGIRTDIIKQSHQLTIRYGDNPKEYTLIAEEKIEEGKYYLRGTESGNKKSNGGSFSVITCDGRRLKESDMADYNDKNIIIIFEGEIDYKSWMSGIDKKNIFDYIVLNSTINAENIIPFISGYKKVNLCLDNDDAGRRATETIISLLKQNGDSPKVEDRSGLYKTYKKTNGEIVHCKDYSEYHTAQWKDRYHSMIINSASELSELKKSLKAGQDLNGPKSYISKTKFL